MLVTDIWTEFIIVKQILVQMDISVDSSLSLTDKFWLTNNWSKLSGRKILTDWQSGSAHCSVSCLPFKTTDVLNVANVSSPHSFSLPYFLFLSPGLWLLLQCSLSWMRWVVIQGVKVSLDFRLKTRNKIKFLVFLFLRGDFPGQKRPH